MLKNNMRNLFPILLFCAASITIDAQQLPYYSQYMLNGFLLNPAVTGTQEGIPVALTYRNQWAGFTDAPKTFTLSGNGMTGKRIGLGGIVFAEKTGPVSRTGIQGTYAYHMELTDQIKLSLGIGGMFHQHVLDQSKLNLDEANDVAVLGIKQKDMVADANFGFYVYHKNFYSGFSVPQLFQNKVELESNKGNLNRLYRHYFFNLGGRFQLNEKTQLEPSLLIKSVAAAPYQFDLNCKALLENKYWIGLSYRDQESIVFLAGLEHKQFRIGVSYDYCITSVRKYSSGSHEIYLAYNIQSILKKKTKEPTENEPTQSFPEPKNVE
ncbi:hypothetical protein FLAV_02874 [Flavobacteriales bacterium]|nr:MAG: membrane protein [Bacteroidota bacterium]CAG0999803.1 hypothetical protein FLAV_02874 [Flavobacteriales bacterium]